MRLEDCVLDGNVFITAPFTRTEPEQEWLAARNSGSIPNVLFDLYCRANYLSFGGATRFFKDPDNILFSYFSMLLRSVMESLVDSKEQVDAFIQDQNLAFDEGKKMRGETWDPQAHKRARRHFRDLLITLQSSLDSLADLIALFFTGRIPGLRVGRAQFGRVEDWLKNAPESAVTILVTPYHHYLRQLFDALEPIVKASGPERDWLPLMRMLRNKVAHLGQPVFRQVGLHDKTPKFYTFIPRQWPFIWEQHLKPSGGPPSSQDFVAKFFNETLIHQDVVTYAEGLRGKVKDVIRSGVSVLASMYIQIQDFEPNQHALAELQGSSQTYFFESFANA